MAGKPEFMRLAGGHCRNGKSPFRALTHLQVLQELLAQAECRNGKSPFRALYCQLFTICRAERRCGMKAMHNHYSKEVIYETGTDCYD